MYPLEVDDDRSARVAADSIHLLNRFHSLIHDDADRVCVKVDENENDVEDDDRNNHSDWLDVKMYLIHNSELDHRTDRSMGGRLLNYCLRSVCEQR